jgi:hypothetical protein
MKWMEESDQFCENGRIASTSRGIVQYRKAYGEIFSQMPADSANKTI